MACTLGAWAVRNCAGCGERAQCPVGESRVWEGLSWVRPPGTGIITSEIKHVSLPTHAQAINTRRAAARCGGRSGSRGSVVGAWGDSRRWRVGSNPGPRYQVFFFDGLGHCGNSRDWVAGWNSLSPEASHPLLQLHSWPLYDSGPSWILSQPGVVSGPFIGSQELSDA